MSKASINIDINDSRVQVSAAAIGRLSKQDEIELVNALARQLPDGYLKDTLSHIKIQFESDVRSDFPCIPNLQLIEAQCVELDKRRSELIVNVEQLQQDLKEIRQGHCNLLSNIRGAAMQSRDDAERLASMARSVLRNVEKQMGLES